MSQASQTAQTRRRPTPRLGRSVIQLVRDLARDLFDPYRPERHYMRGPGPKCQAKHAAAAAPAPATLHKAAI